MAAKKPAIKKSRARKPGAAHPHGPLTRRRVRLDELRTHLYGHYGPLNWWPGESPFEVVVGAVLTQNTSWKNVEKAIANLKRANVLDLEAIDRLPPSRLAKLLVPAGYFNIKTKRLKSVVRHVVKNHGTLERFFSQPLGILRAELLGVHGVGPETADSILCYAAELPSFVVDTYTRRILARHNLVDPEIKYEPLRGFCMEEIPAELQVYNEFHAALVAVGNRHCKPSPSCDGCPLQKFL